MTLSMDEVYKELLAIKEKMDDIIMEEVLEQREEAAEVLLSEMQEHDELMNEVLDQAVHWFYSVTAWADLMPQPILRCEEELYSAVERLLIHEGRDLEVTIR